MPDRRPRSVVQVLLAAARAMVGRRREAPGEETTRPGPAVDPLTRYRIERELGRGAMGTVHLARDTVTGRVVALKRLTLARELAGDDLREAHVRFLREADAARRLNHPDIVAVLDAGGDATQAWIVMAHVPGEPLSRHVEPATLLPVAQVLACVERVARALAHAHAQGIVHRDIKPANLMFDATTGRVTVMDFGVAHLVDASRTRTGMMLGTPAYMAPELLAGERVDARSDLYALGVVLFELLAGRLPHAGDTLAELMGRIANQPAPDIRSLRPDLPEMLANVVALALQKRPDLRYADGRQLADDLAAVAALQVPPPAEGEPPMREKCAREALRPGLEPRHNSGS